MVDEDAGGPLVNRITSIRKQVSKTLGFVVPPVRIRDDLSLKANQHRIRIGQTIVEDEAFPNRKLAIPGENYMSSLMASRSKPDFWHGCHLDPQRAGSRSRSE